MPFNQTTPYYTLQWHDLEVLRSPLRRQQATLEPLTEYMLEALPVSQADKDTLLELLTESCSIHQVFFDDSNGSLNTTSIIHVTLPSRPWEGSPDLSETETIVDQAILSWSAKDFPLSLPVPPSIGESDLLACHLKYRDDPTSGMKDLLLKQVLFPVLREGLSHQSQAIASMFRNLDSDTLLKLCHDQEYLETKFFRALGLYGGIVADDRGYDNVKDPRSGNGIQSQESQISSPTHDTRLVEDRTRRLENPTAVPKPEPERPGPKTTQQLLAETLNTDPFALIRIAQEDPALESKLRSFVDSYNQVTADDLRTRSAEYHALKKIEPPKIRPKIKSNQTPIHEATPLGLPIRTASPLILPRHNPNRPITKPRSQASPQPQVSSRKQKIPTPEASKGNNEDKLKKGLPAKKTLRKQPSTKILHTLSAGSPSNSGPRVKAIAHCESCGGEGHLRADCVEPRRGSTPAENIQRRNLSKMRCLKCFQPGHLKRNCHSKI